MKIIKPAITFLSIAFLLVLEINVAYSQNVLTELPFGIIIGTTTNEEIEDKGSCVRFAKDEKRCELYDMAGNFSVYSSQNQVVNKIKFSAKEDNKLPRKWMELGLRFGTKDAPGTLDIDFRNIIKSNGAKFIESSRDYDSSGEVQGINFTYELGKLSYEVLIRTVDDDANLSGLYELTLTEAY